MQDLSPVADFQRTDFFVSAKGGVVHYYDGETLVMSIAVPAGRRSCREYYDLARDGLVAQSDLLAVVSRKIVHVTASSDRYHSAANPDFQPMNDQDRKIADLARQVSELRNASHVQAYYASPAVAPAAEVPPPAAPVQPDLLEGIPAA
jgi:hypothetical protein